MNKLDYICICIAIAAIIFAAYVVMFKNRKTKGTSEEYNKLPENLTNEKDRIQDIISDISNQTKVPISNILFYVQMLEDYELPEGGKECLKALSEQSKRLRALIDSLVKASGIESGIITVSPQEEKIQTLFNEVLEQIEYKANERGLIFLIEETEDVAYFDLRWTIEAICNIVDNAVKYTSSGKCIMIKSTPAEQFLCIDIIDEGIGIDPEEQDKIFSRFYQAKEAKDQDGIGIGLYLAKEIIKIQGGDIKVTSKLTEGTTFSVFLPISK